MPVVLLVLALLTLGCDRPAALDTTLPQVDAGPASVVRVGAGVLADDGFGMLAGQRVGLIVNHTARVDSLHLIDLLHRAPEVESVAIFAPEHGLRGTADAGAKIEDGRDPRTDLPVRSLYGDTRKPTPAMLEGIDVLVFDMQDVGVRFYTYISTMGLAMQAAAEAGIPFVVLDRPDPLGGTYVAGWMREDGFESFVGQYRIPIAHGMTVGELARMIQGEALLDGLEGLDLRVVEMQGWHREALWPATGRAWHAPSPNLPTFDAALAYPGTALFEGTTASEGRGTDAPFLTLGAPGIDALALLDTLATASLPGVRFEPARFTPRPNAGASKPKRQGEELEGVRLHITDPAAFRGPVETGVHLLHAFYHQAPEREAFLNDRWLGLLAGTDRLREALVRGDAPDAIIASWRPDVEAFRAARAPYLLY